jgi:DNA-binding transcriptional MerR regulator
MNKAADAVRTIGEVSLELDLKPHILRYWEEQFSMLKPMKRSGGRRYYRTEDIALLRTIDGLLNKEGYTIKGAKKILKGKSKSENAAEDSASVSDAPQADIDMGAVQSELLAIRKMLAEALA